MHALRDDTYRRIADLMYATIGLSFSDSKKPLVSSRLASRIERLGLRISVYGGDGNGLAGHEGQQARLVVEVAGHVATLAPVESERQSRGEVSP